MRTQEEIVEKIRASKNNFLDFEGEAILPYLDYDHAKEFIRSDITREKWEVEHRSSLNETVVLSGMEDYARFAWGKAQDHRGLSANRSIDKLEAWTWLLGRDDVLKASEEAEYKNYGCPKLAVICEAFGFPIPQDEETQRMIHGEPCQPGCGNGCG